MSDTVAVGGPAPNSLPGTDGAPTGTATTLSEFKASRWCSSSIGDNTSMHPAAQQLRPTSTSSGRSTPRCWPSALSRWRATTASAPTRAGSPSRCWRTPTRPWAGVHILGPVGFWRSIFVVDGEGTVRYVHRAVAGLWFRATDEVVEAVRGASV